MLKYVLILALGAALVRFLNNLARLGRDGRQSLRPDAEDAEYEILPDEPDPDADPAG